MYVYSLYIYSIQCAGRTYMYNSLGVDPLLSTPWPMYRIYMHINVHTNALVHVQYMYICSCNIVKSKATLYIHIHVHL